MKVVTPEASGAGRGSVSRPRYKDAVRGLDPDRVAAGVVECELAKARIGERINSLCEEAG